MLFIKYQEEWKDQSLSDSVRFVSWVLKYIQGNRKTMEWEDDY